MAVRQAEQQTVKMILRAMGVRTLRIKFDCQARALEARYIQHGTEHVRIIAFKEFEEMFNEHRQSIATVPAGSGRPSAGAPVE